ncbi:MAG: Ig-like domain-containing protein [Gemmataceae bacterium]
MLQSDGRIVVAGTTDYLTTDNDANDFFLVRVFGGGPPTMTVSTGGGTQGSPVTFVMNTVSPVANNTSFTYRFDWNGDGVVDQTDAGKSANYSVTHTFNGPQQNLVRITVTDANGLSYTVTRTVRVNYRPVAVPATRQTATGAVMSHVLGADDRNPEVVQGFTYAIVTGPSHGAVRIENGWAYYTPNPGYKGTDQFTYTATDDASAGGSALTSEPATISITVQNATPQPRIRDTPYQVAEGEPITIRGEFTDANPEDTHPWMRWTLRGSGVILAVGSGASFTFTPPGRGTYSVRFEVADSEGAVGSDERGFEVLNVAPIAAIAGPVRGVVGQPLTFHLSATDVNPQDQRGEFEYDLFDGNGAESVRGFDRLSITRTFATPGTYTIRMWARNKDTYQESPEATHTVVVEPTVASTAPVGSAVQVNDIGLSQFSPEMAIARHTDGSYVVVWERRQDHQSRDDVFARRFSATGAPLGPAFLVHAASGHDQYDPRIAMDAAGNFVVIWSHTFVYDEGAHRSPRGCTPGGSPPTGRRRRRVPRRGPVPGGLRGEDAAGNFVVAWVGASPYADIRAAARWRAAGRFDPRPRAVGFESGAPARPMPRRGLRPDLARQRKPAGCPAIRRGRQPGGEPPRPRVLDRPAGRGCPTAGSSSHPSWDSRSTPCGSAPTGPGCLRRSSTISCRRSGTIRGRR